MRRPGRFVITSCLVAGLAVGAAAGAKGRAASHPKQTDVEFARSAFTLLANGDLAVQRFIDWEHFSSVGTNVGAQYNAMPNEVAKAGFRRGFVSSFSKSFRGRGARAESLTHWRVKSHDATKTVVAADSPKPATLLMTVSKPNGQQKLRALEIDKG